MATLMLRRSMMSLALLASLAAGGAQASSQPGRGGGSRRELASLTRERLAHAEVGRDGRYHAPLEGKAQAVLTLEPRLQRMAERVLHGHRTPYAAAVLLSVDDGRVLAMAGRSTEEPAKSAADLCLSPWAPAASIFKLVTTAALLDAGVKPSTKVCYHDGIHSVEASNLVDHPRLDTSCNSLSYGLAKSQNAIVARLASEHLLPSTLLRAARALGFDERLPGDLPASPSQASIPDEALAFARVAAGFWQTTLSPLHGAWLAATIARGGTTPPLHVVSRVLDDRGWEAPAPTPSRRVLDEHTAHALGRMMVGTTEFGTAHRGFHDHAGQPYLPGIAVAGKTGTLNRKQGPYLSYSWFVGFAPATRPQVAVSVLVGNGADDNVKAHHVARELLEGWFRSDRRDLVATR